MKLEDKKFFSIDPDYIRHGRLAIGVLFLLDVPINLFFGNPASLSTGRWSWIYLSVTEMFGPYGYPLLHVAIGLLFIAWSRSK
jgi:hypothetical protein